MLGRRAAVGLTAAVLAVAGAGGAYAATRGGSTSPSYTTPTAPTPRTTPSHTGTGHHCPGMSSSSSAMSPAAF